MPYIGTGRISLSFSKRPATGGIPLLLLHELGGSSESCARSSGLLATDRSLCSR